MHIVVINLDRQTERWASIAPQFAALGLGVSRLPAVDGNRLGATTVGRLYDSALNRSQYHKPLRPGEIGCYASHIAAWQELLASRAQRLAVFEDDVDLDAALPQVLDAIDRTRVPYDLVKLVGRSREKLAVRVALDDPWQLVGYQRVPGLTSGYVISRHGAEKLLAGRIPFGRPVDVDLRHHWECGLTILGVQPYPVRPAASSHASSIEGRHLPVSVDMRWRKLLLQARYTLLNAGHALVDANATDSGHRLPIQPDAARPRQALQPQPAHPLRRPRA